MDVEKLYSDVFVGPPTWDVHAVRMHGKHSPLITSVELFADLSAAIVWNEYIRLPVPAGLSCMTLRPTRKISLECVPLLAFSIVYSTDRFFSVVINLFSAPCGFFQDAL